MSAYGMLLLLAVVGNFTNSKSGLRAGSPPQGPSDALGLWPLAAQSIFPGHHHLQVPDRDRSARVQGNLFLEARRLASR
uniref:Putative secreted protein n=1 Tax=Anopheles triannulatus TaxID=58253 RepID=A0A2M4B7A8_9DIPT